MKDKPKIYNQNVLQHYQNPHNKGKMKNPDYSATEENPNCGDRITIELKVQGSKIQDAKFDGHGCVLSVGSASILTQMIRGLQIQDALELTMDDLVDNMGNPAKLRKDCITLSLNALRNALSSRK